MIDLGHFSLVCAWFLALYAVVIGGVGAVKRDQRYSSSAVGSLHLTAVMGFGALSGLGALFLQHDYRYRYVWQTSNNDMPWYYLVSAIWGGMDGSLLLWAVMMCMFASAVVFRVSSMPRELGRWLTPVLSAASLFFLSVVLFLTNPFRMLPEGALPPDGNGLNPLLQNPSMLIHPPMLYSGFTGFVVPFAFCVAALLSGDLSDQWIVRTRRWTLIAWGLLTCGIVLGGNWAYIELGWGGFWAWDPVENASFLPWLTGTAFLHSVMVQERKGMLKVWNVSLAISTYLLSVFGTFLTRSGIVQSVHAFAETDFGWVFLAYIAAVALLCGGLVAFRWSSLRPERRLESYLSREAAFLFNNLILLAICFATFWGVMFPVLSEWLTGEKSVVGPPFFNQVNVPLFLALLFMMGVGPLIAWRRASLSSMRKTFAAPMLTGSTVVLLCLLVDPGRVYPALGFGLSVFAIATVEGEFRRGAKARRQLMGDGAAASVLGLVRSRPRKYGGFIVHLGVGVMAFAITASMAYKIERDVVLRAGESVRVGPYSLTFVGMQREMRKDHSALIATLEAYEGGSTKLLGMLKPEKRAYVRNEETTSEVDIRMTLRDDLYVALTGIEVSGTAEAAASQDPTKAPAMFKVFVNPLQIWLWAGALITLFGTVIVLEPFAYLRRVSEAHAHAPGAHTEGIR